MKSYENAPHNIQGKKGEEKVLAYFQSNENIIDIQDVRNVDEYQNKDIDFIVKTQVDGKIETQNVEVKTDLAAGTWGNLFVEKSNYYLKDCTYIDDDGQEVVFAKKGETTKGWMLYSECDYFFFYVPKHNKIYTVNREVLRKYIVTNQPPIRQCKDYHKITDGWCVKITDLLAKNSNSVVVLDCNDLTSNNILSKVDTKEVA